jgi:hypothetical protein
MHGVATFSVMAYFCEVGVPEIIVPMLMMKVSRCAGQKGIYLSTQPLSSQYVSHSPDFNHQSVSDASYIHT